jgi:hypothetical protein
MSLFIENPTAAKALRLTAALDKIEDSLLSIDGFAAMQLAVVDQNRDFALLIQGMGPLMLVSILFWQLSFESYRSDRWRIMNYRMLLPKEYVRECKLLICFILRLVNEIDV